MASGRRFLTAAAVLLCAAVLAGCVSVPTSGQPQQYRPTQGTGVSEQQYLQADTEPPGLNWDPEQIVAGFLAANATFAGNHEVARDYLTPQARGEWGMDWSAGVFKGVPSIQEQPRAQSSLTATVTVGGSLQASVKATGTYAVPGPMQGPANTFCGVKGSQITIGLVKTGGQWRINDPPPCLLLSATDFQATYQQRDLYFFDPSLKYLVADPVYVPVATAPSADPQDVLTKLVQDLISPPSDWLVSATRTTFPRGTRVQPVTLGGGVAFVSLQGAAIGRANPEQIAAQLLWTLLGSADSQPVIQGVQLSINGKTWTTTDANPVLQKSDSAYSPPAGVPSKSSFYYLDSKGNVWRRSGPNGRGVKVLTAPAKGPHLSTIGVSPDGKYLAGLINGAIYTARIGGTLHLRDSGLFTSVSWDPSDHLWAADSSGAVVLPAAAGAPAVVNVPTSNTITALRVAPDGVRVALVMGGTTIQFAAITRAAGNPAEPAIRPDAFSPFLVSGSGISDVAWYGPDNVIALSGAQGARAQATEYTVNGGTPVQVLQQAGMTNITASWDNALIASTASGALLYSETIGGAWVPLPFNGRSAVYPG